MEKRLIEPHKNYTKTTSNTAISSQQDPRNIKNSLLSDEKRQQLWLSDLCVKYGELSITPSTNSLSSTCYSGTESSSLCSATDYEIDEILLADHTDTESTASWNDTNSSYEYYWSSSNTE